MASSNVIKSSSTQWPGVFEEKPPGEKGGLYVEGVVTSLRYHSIHCQRDIHRYLAVQLKVGLARDRVFDARGLEVEPSRRGLKALRLGYAAGTFKPTKPDDPTPVFIGDLAKKVGGEGGSAALPAGYCPEQKDSLHPRVSGVFEFWADIAKSKNADLKEGAIVFVFTRGNSVFIDNMNRADKGEFRGHEQGDVLNGWDKQLQQFAEGSTEEDIPGQDLEGCADEEWDD